MQMSDEVLKHEYDYDRIQLHCFALRCGKVEDN